ncbi:MAG: acyl-ACP--UDP-N-acetylglucosamine O-acyltransferase [Acidihalobacter sp.]|jgi:UDP-N-acetylglucosamine acyltransferase
MIHPQAVVDPRAELADDVTVGPFAVIGGDVRIDSGTTVGPHAVIEGPTRIGKDNRIYQFVSLGAAPQDKKYRGEATELIIGDRNLIREYCTFNRGTVQDLGYSKVGDDNWIMAYVHLAHDCVVGNHTIFANGATLAGHVTIEDYAILGGFSLIHQFVRVGAYAFTGMGSAVSRDVPPYVTASGNLAKPHGLNAEGLRRNGFTGEQISRLRHAYKTLYRAGLRLEEAMDALRAEAGHPEIERLLRFLENSKRSIIR